MIYTIDKHKHRFAAWAASRAASVNGCRFSVEQGKQIIESCKINKVISSINNLPKPSNFDMRHREWRNNIIEVAQQKQLAFTHGVAAKLVNIYLKSIFVCGGSHNETRVKAIHPPIDSVLLDQLYKLNIGGQRKEWQTARRIKWSKFNSEQYENVINAIKRVLPEDSGLWQIEEYWKGFV